MFGLVPQWPRASTFLACQAGGLAAGLLAAFLLARVSLPEWLAAPSLHPQVRRRLVSVGSWQALALAGGQLSGQIDRYLLGAFLLPQNVGFYNVAQRLEEAIYVGVIKISETLFPFFSTLSDSEKTRQSDLFFRAAWLLGLVAVSVLGGLIPVAGDILRLWVGANVAAEAERVLVILTIAGIIGSGTNVFSLFLTATGGTRGNAILSMVTAFATVTTSVVALPMFGWAAAGFSSLVGMLAQMAIMLALLSRRFDMAGSAARIVQDLLTPIVAGIIVAFALRAIFMGHGPWSWWQPIAAYMFSAATISFAVIAIGVWGRYGVMRRQDIVFIARRFLPSRVF
jgi:O-antigen/teichoic acid export membrane protein